MATDRSLTEKRVLVVEDEFFLAEALSTELTAIGACVIGPAPSVVQALALVAGEPALDAALLDINLGGEMAYQVADALLARSVPIVFTSGYDDDALDQRFAHVPRCQKPAEFRTIAQALMDAIAR